MESLMRVIVNYKIIVNEWIRFWPGKLQSWPSIEHSWKDKKNDKMWNGVDQNWDNQKSAKENKF